MDPEILFWFTWLMSPVQSVLLLFLAVWGCCLHSAPSLSRAGESSQQRRHKVGQNQAVPLFCILISECCHSFFPSTNFQKRAAEMVSCWWPVNIGERRVRGCEVWISRLRAEGSISEVPFPRAVPWGPFPYNEMILYWAQEFHERSKNKYILSTASRNMSLPNKLNNSISFVWMCQYHETLCF